MRGRVVYCTLCTVTERFKTILQNWFGPNIYSHQVVERMRYSGSDCHFVLRQSIPYPLTQVIALEHSFTHSGHFYSASSSPLLLGGAPDYRTDTVSEFHAEAHMQL